ncbi:unnamed protein product [Phytophthora fragariaefolia]|uniref:Unnamed protein product n=1 Tax=Phytophthora fragariaefolia TaxID=1490495 RepID=A0A9W6Y2T5_9STRA|nr:unnamed protein product [Phytophthora fragariaefolia]
MGMRTLPSQVVWWGHAGGSGLVFAWRQVRNGDHDDGHVLERVCRLCGEREAEAPGALEPDCEVAKMLHQSLETVSYDAFKAFILQSSNVGIRAEITEIEMHSAHLMSVKYARVPKWPTTNSSGAKVLDVPVQERLKLAVIFDITEHVSLNLPDSDDVEDVAVRRNKSIWQFDSDVSRSGGIDWTIEPLHLVM